MWAETVKAVCVKPVAVLEEERETTNPNPRGPLISLGFI